MEPTLTPRTFDGTIERQVIAGALTSDVFLSSITRYYKQNKMLLRSPGGNQLLQFAAGYYEKHNKAPNEDTWLFLKKYDKDNTLTTLVESLEPVTNPDALLEYATEFFKLVQLERFDESLRTMLMSGKVDPCYDMITSFQRVTDTVTVGIDPLTDKLAIEAAFADTAESLLAFESDDEAAFYGDTFARDSFVMLLAPEKGKKSMFLLDFAVRGMLQNLKVAYFEVGDMSQNQVMRRFCSRVAEYPLSGGRVSFPENFYVTSSTLGTKGGTSSAYNTTPRLQEYPTPLNATIVDEAFEKHRVKLDGKTSTFKLTVCPNSTKSVSDIDNDLQEWERQGWFPDLVVIDYADLLISPSRHSELRHQIDDIFRRLRQLSQKHHCCVLTATQANREASSSAYITRDHISESKTKLAHVTAALGLHSTEYEEQNGVMKVNYVVRRDGACIPSQPMYVAHCLPVCNPAYSAFYPYYRNNPHILSNARRKRASVTPIPEFVAWSEHPPEATECDPGVTEWPTYPIVEPAPEPVTTPVSETSIGIDSEIAEPVKLFAVSTLELGCEVPNFSSDLPTESTIDVIPTPQIEHVVAESTVEVVSVPDILDEEIEIEGVRFKGYKQYIPDFGMWIDITPEEKEALIANSRKGRLLAEEANRRVEAEIAAGTVTYPWTIPNESAAPQSSEPTPAAVLEVPITPPTTVPPPLPLSNAPVVPASVPAPVPSPISMPVPPLQLNITSEMERLYPGLTQKTAEVQKQRDAYNTRITSGFHYECDFSLPQLLPMLEDTKHPDVKRFPKAWLDYKQSPPEETYESMFWNAHKCGNELVVYKGVSIMMGTEAKRRILEERAASTTTR